MTRLGQTGFACSPLLVTLYDISRNSLVGVDDAVVPSAQAWFRIATSAISNLDMGSGGVAPNSRARTRDRTIILSHHLTKATLCLAP
jgi:hypothetical protein